MRTRTAPGPARLLLACITTLSLLSACSSGSTAGNGGGADGDGGDTTSAAATTASEEPTQAPAAGGGRGDIPAIADGTYTGGTAHLEVSGDKTLVVDLPLLPITSTTVGGFTLLTYSAGDGEANVSLNVIVDPEVGPSMSLASAVVFSVGGREQGCAFEFTRNDGSGVSGTVACSDLEGMSAGGLEQPIVDIHGTFTADL